MADTTRRSRWIAGALIVVLILAAAALLAATGIDPLRAGRALISGSLGSWYAFGSGTLVRATPLILTGLSVAVSFRAGVFNIGADGQFLVGAAAATWVALLCGASSSWLVIPALLVASATAGAAWAGTAAVLRTRFHVLEVISTLMLNFVASYLISYLVRGPLQEPTRVYPQTPSIADAARMPRFGPTTRLHLGFAVAILACVCAWWTIRFTAAGFRLRLVGANPDAARSAAQIDVNRVTTNAFLVSGAIAGIAGALEVSGVTFALYENISPGYGYTAIAVALLARLDAGAVIATGILFGALETGASAMQRDAGAPSVIVSIIEAGIILALVAVERMRFAATASSTSVRSPAAE
jgi:general nucleoside transport system permease protein